MAKLQPFLISGLNEGLETDVEPFLLPDKAYPTMENAYTWRGKVKKREGITVLGRLRRVLTSQSLGNTTADDTITYNTLFSTLSITGEDPDIQPSSLVITIGAPDTATFTDQGDGTFAVTGLGNAAGSYVNYQTGLIVLKFTSTLTGGAAVSADFNYYPSLPVMGIINRETAGINNEQAIFFDTKYAYIYSGSAFSEFITGTTWDADDYNFMQGENYTGSTSANKLLFTTNFIPDTTDNPMRYTDGSTWTDFTPALAGSQISNESLSAVTTPWTSGSGTLTNTPVIAGSVTITLQNGTDPDVIIFTDPLGDGVLRGSPNTSTGTINYATGAVSFITISPAFTVDTTPLADYQYSTSYLITARFLVPYYGRLLALNTYEGTSMTNVNYFNRLRACQVGSPTEANAWVSTIYGKGIYIDAPINEEIIGYDFFKSQLIIGFERSTWLVRYQGDYGLPFIWEKISSDYGTESQFSMVRFDEGILSVGDKAIINSTSQTVSRIDEKIPDTVFTFRNQNNGQERVHGIRDFQKELVYWNYNNSVGNVTNQKFPNYSLVYNYKYGSWSIFRNNVTVFGTYRAINAITWDRLDIYWDDFEASWDDIDEQAQFPYIVSGNQQGFIHYYGYSSLDEYSLKIKSIDRSVTPIQLEVINHNLNDGDIIYLEDLTFIDTSDSSSVSTDLNDRTFQVKNLSTYDADVFEIIEWDTSVTPHVYITNYSYTPANGTGEYIGNGKVTLLPKMKIRTKDFNPFLSQGKQFKISFIDFLTNTTENGNIAINLYLDTTLQEKANLLVGQTNFPIQGNSFSNQTQAKMIWNRFFSSAFGQFISVEITYNDDQMNDRDVYNAYFILNALMIWGKEGGRLV